MFYFFNLIFLLIYALMYATFREGLRSAHKISHKSNLKGAKNYWWFEGVRESNALGKAYHVNKAFTVFFLFVATVVLFMGFLSFAKIMVIALMGVLGVVLIPMNFYSWYHNNEKEFGKAFVLFEKRKDGTGKYHSSIIDIFWSILPVFMILFEIFYLL